MPGNQRHEPRNALSIDANQRGSELTVHEDFATLRSGVVKRAQPREDVEEHAERTCQPVAREPSTPY